MTTRKTWTLASFVAAFLLGSGAVHAQNPESRAPRAPTKSPAHAPAKSTATPTANRAPYASPVIATALDGSASPDAALIGATWAHMLVTAMRSWTNVAALTARQLATRREDAGAAALKSTVAVKPPADDGPRLQWRSVRVTYVHVEPPIRAGSDGRGERADLPGIAVALPP